MAGQLKDSKKAIENAVTSAAAVGNTSFSTDGIDSILLRIMAY
jgi:hypothetical protein